MQPRGESADDNMASSTSTETSPVEGENASAPKSNNGLLKLVGAVFIVRAFVLGGAVLAGLSGMTLFSSLAATIAVGAGIGLVLGGVALATTAAISKAASALFCQNDDKPYQSSEAPVESKLVSFPQIDKNSSTDDWDLNVDNFDMLQQKAEEPAGGKPVSSSQIEEGSSIDDCDLVSDFGSLQEETSDSDDLDSLIL